MEPIFFFDGVCNLCNATVDFLLRHDRRGRLRFAPLQGPTAQRLLEGRVVASGETGIPDGVVLWEAGRVSMRSSAALRSLVHMGGVWRLGGLFMAVPRPLRDAVYDLVAHRRYRWFGRRDSCRLPTPAEAERFLD